MAPSQDASVEPPADLKSRSLPTNPPAVDAKWPIEPPVAAFAGAAVVAGAAVAGEAKVPLQSPSKTWILTLMDQ